MSEDFNGLHFLSVEPSSVASVLNSSPPEQNGRHFANDIFRCIFMNENFCILIKISLKFVPKGLIDNNAALVQVMTWRRIGDKLLLEPILTQVTDAYMRHYGEMSLKLLFHRSHLIYFQKVVHGEMIESANIFHVSSKQFSPWKVNEWCSPWKVNIMPLICITKNTTNRRQSGHEGYVSFEKDVHCIKSSGSRLYHVKEFIRHCSRDVSSAITEKALLRLFQLWRSSRHSRLPHRRASCPMEQDPLPAGRLPMLARALLENYI